jgi:hypothetical protein
LGSRLARLPKAEATELAPEAVGAGPLTAIKTRVVSTGRLGGPSGTTSAFGETPERRLWAIQREDRRAGPAHQIGFTLRSLSTAADWGDRRSPASSRSGLLRCDLCGLVSAEPVPGQPRVDNAGVDQAFFSGTRIVSNFICPLGVHVPGIVQDEKTQAVRSDRTWRAVAL